MMHMPGKIGKRGLQLGQNLGRGASLLIVELIIRRDHPPQLVLSGNVGFKWSTLEKSPYFNEITHTMSVIRIIFLLFYYCALLKVLFYLLFYLLCTIHSC